MDPFNGCEVHLSLVLTRLMCHGFLVRLADPANGCEVHLFLDLIHV